MIDILISLANKLDNCGFINAANEVDGLVKSASEKLYDDLMEWNDDKLLRTNFNEEEGEKPENSEDFMDVFEKTTDDVDELDPDTAKTRMLMHPEGLPDYEDYLEHPKAWSSPEDDDYSPQDIDEVRNYEDLMNERLLQNRLASMKSRR